MVSLAHALMLLYVFAAFSRFFELVGRGLRIPLVLAVVILTLCLVTGRVMRGFTSRVGISFVLLTGWFLASGLFGVWPRGSLDSILNGWSKNWSLYLMIVALTADFRQCSRVIMALALGATGAALTALFSGEQKVGRLVVGESSLGDPNDLALLLLVALPFWFVVIGDRRRSLLVRWGAVLLCLPMLAAAARTGSRGAMVGAAIVALYLLKRASLVGKMGLAVALGLLVIAGSFLLTEEVRARYTGQDAVAASSTESRLYLAEQALRLIARNPLFGTGYAVFEVAENDLAKEQGLARGAWHTSHSMYLQIASEAGIPALILYLGILTFCWKTLTQIERTPLENHPQARQIARTGYWMKVSLLAFCATGAFLSVGLSTVFCALCGVIIALRKAVGLEAERAAATAVEKQPASQSTLVPVGR
jgi:O-antigen ligase